MDNMKDLRHIVRTLKTHGEIKGKTSSAGWALPFFPSSTVKSTTKLNILWFFLHYFAYHLLHLNCAIILLNSWKKMTDWHSDQQTAGGLPYKKNIHNEFIGAHFDNQTLGKLKYSQ